MLTSSEGRIKQNQFFIVCHGHLWNCQGHRHGYLLDCWNRSLGTQGQFDRWLSLDGQYDVHHRSRAGNPSPRGQGHIGLLGVYRHGCDDLSLCHWIFRILGTNSLGVSWRGGLCSYSFFLLANDVSFRYSPLVFAPMVLALEQPHSGCSTLSSPRSLLMT